MNTYLGLEFGSTRIKAVVVDDSAKVLAKGAYDWENSLVGGLFTYPEEQIFEGLRTCFGELCRDYEKNFGTSLSELTSMGFSGMMHGYIALDKDGNMLVPFRTWRNTNTAEAADILTKELGFNIPMRWSISHLYQCILNGEEHLSRLDYLTTLSGYIHYKLTGERVIGAGEGSGMFPIDSETLDYDEEMVRRFDLLISDKGYSWKLRDVLPKVLPAGADAGKLTEAGVKMLGEDCKLPAGIPMCPPEGDAGTGMVATNSVKVRTGNVSAGTSSFAMVVLEKMTSSPHTEIDMVTTPDGAPVAMVHANTCTSDINAWTGLFAEFAKLLGVDIPTGKLFDMLFAKSLEGDPDCGGIVSYNFLAGEPVVGLNAGRPLLMRAPDAKMNLANFYKTQIYASLATLAVGMDILRGEGVDISEIVGHGGFFKAPEVGQRAMSAAMGCPVTVLETAGEGGPWGMAVLSAYFGSGSAKRCSLGEYLDGIFKNEKKLTLSATEDDKRDFAMYIEAFKAGLPVEKAASEL